MRIAFNPQAAGSRPGALNVSGTPGGTATTTLSGTGLTPANLTLTGASSNFGNVLIPNTASLSFAVTNTGQSPSGPLSFSLTGTDFQNVTPENSGDCVTGATLGVGLSCNLLIRFTASLPQGAKTAVLGASATPGGSPTLSLSGVAQRPAVLTPATTSLDFGNVEVNTSSTIQTWQLTNGGDVPTAQLTTTTPAGYTRCPTPATRSRSPPAPPAAW